MEIFGNFNGNLCKFLEIFGNFYKFFEISMEISMEIKMQIFGNFANFWKFQWKLKRKFIIEWKYLKILTETSKKIPTKFNISNPKQITFTLKNPTPTTTSQTNKPN